MLRASRTHARYIGALAFTAALIVLSVSLVLRQQSIAVNRAERVLDCHFAGTAAHTHNADCYDADGNLVCPLEERALHTHTDDCYTESRELVCGQKESAGHTHTSACYDADGNLVCGQEESAGHIHTDACYQVTRTLTCGQEEITQTHVHGAGCFRTVVASYDDDEPAQADGQATSDVDEAADQATDAGQPAADLPDASTHPAQDFSHQFKDEDENLLLRVDVTAPVGALPEGTAMVATWVDPADFTRDVQKAVDRAISRKAYGKVTATQAVDISFVDPQGQEIEPLCEVTVKLTSPLVDTKDQPLVVHVDESVETLEANDGKPKAKVVDELGKRELRRREMELADDELAFDSDAFSTYVLAVTTLEHRMKSTDGETVTITVDAPADAGIPADAKLQVSEVAQGSEEHAAYEAQANEALGMTDARNVALARFFDIKIVDGEGQELQPQAPVSVKVELADAPEDAQATSVVHFAEAEQAPEVIAAQAEGDTTTFDATGFSVYGVVYTVDFHWAANGQVFDFSIEGGGVLSLRELLPALGVVAEDEADELVAEVADVVFFDESLVVPAYVSEDMTAAVLEQTLGVEPQYSADLSKEQVAELEAKQLSAGDWALVTLQPFDTDETLTVTLKNGDEFEIAVTDARLVAKVLTADGQGWEITVEYDDAAEIPAGATLQARELEEGTVEYEKYLTGSAVALGVRNEDVTLARFFDIAIMVDGEKYEPKAPVQVSIRHADALDVELGDTLSVVHFADEPVEEGADSRQQAGEDAAESVETPEVITDVELSEDGTEVRYEQASFSVTGTVVAPQNNGSNYMVLIKDEIEGSPVTFIVNNDGTLSLVNAEYNPDGSVKSVEVDEPMTWTYKNGHLYHPYDAVAYNVDKAGSAFAYRYINPAADSGLTTETIDNIHFDGWDQQSGRTASDSARARDYWNSTVIDYDAANHALKNGNNYLGVGTNSESSIAIIGNAQSSNAAEVYFATPDKVTKPGGVNSGVTARDNVVNHIDISVSGSSTIDVPLAFGNYYEDDDIENPNRTPILTVARNAEVTLKASSPVSIDLSDMKRAIITAYQIDRDGSIVHLDDAFYVTGYSQNEANEIGDKAPQVRIEGAFKTAKAMHGESDTWLNTRDSSTGRFENRLASRVYYSVSVVKPVTFIPEYNGQELYDESGKRIEITLDITMTASFNYWDEGNNCPPVTNQLTFQGNHWSNAGNVAEWKKGGYPNSGPTWDGMNYSINGDFADISGMDFVLGGNAEDADSKIVAIEITKMIVDQDGGLIPLKTEVSQSFDIYSNNSDDPNNVIGLNVPTYSAEYSNYSTYRNIHTKDMKVGTSGMGLVYDYDITPGMYYIEEDASKIPQTIVAANDEEWQYVETRVDTEYVWRNDMYAGHHVSATYNDPETQSYRSVPEVAGNYYGLLNPASTEQLASSYNSATWHYNGETGTYRNGFLEFFVYNVYKKVESETDVTLKKVDSDDLNETDPEYLKGASFTLTKYTSDSFEAADKDTAWGDSGSMTLSDTKNQDDTYSLNGIFTFEGLTEGFYRIEETDLPDGYVKLTSDPTFKVEANASKELEITLISNPDNLLRLEGNEFTIVIGNTPGAELPAAGGSGTTALYALGAALVAAGALYLAVRRRTEA